MPMYVIRMLGNSPYRGWLVLARYIFLFPLLLEVTISAFSNRLSSTRTEFVLSPNSSARPRRYAVFSGLRKSRNSSLILVFEEMSASNMASPGQSHFNFRSEEHTSELQSLMRTQY